MNAKEIPLSSDNQQFSITIAQVQYVMRINWREPCWYLDLLNADLSPVALALPLITGADLLAQYSYLNLGFSLVVVCDVSGQENPTELDLGADSHLLIVTE